MSEKVFIYPVMLVTADTIPENCRCSWGYTETYRGPGQNRGHFWLKFVAANCAIHAGTIKVESHASAKQVRMWDGPDFINVVNGRYSGKKGRKNRR